MVLPVPTTKGISIFDKSPKIESAIAVGTGSAAIVHIETGCKKSYTPNIGGNTRAMENTCAMENTRAMNTRIK